MSPDTHGTGTTPDRPAFNEALDAVRGVADDLATGGASDEIARSMPKTARAMSEAADELEAALATIRAHAVSQDRLIALQAEALDAAVRLHDMTLLVPEKAIGPELRRALSFGREAFRAKQDAIRREGGGL